MNRRAQIPIIVLTIGIFALCSLALITFVNSSINVGNSFIDTNSIQKVNSYTREAEFYISQGKNPFEIMNIFKENVSEGDFIYRGEKRENGEYLISVSLLEKKSLFFREKIEIFYFEKSFFE